MKIRKYKSADLEQYVSVVRETYQKTNAREATRAGMDAFLSLLDVKTNRKRIEKVFQDSTYVGVAVEQKKIVGVVRIMHNLRNKDTKSYWLSNLFVLPSYHRHGVGGQLLQIAIDDVEKRGGREIKCMSSIYAIPFYTKYGFKKTTGVRNVGGKRVQPMRKSL